jgi:hypothetical protein
MEVRRCSIRTVGRMRENKFKMQNSAGKVTARVIRDSEENLLVEFLKRDATIQSNMCIH